MTKSSVRKVTADKARSKYRKTTRKVGTGKAHSSDRKTASKAVAEARAVHIGRAPLNLSRSLTTRKCQSRCGP